MKLDYKRTFFVGFAFMSICSFWQIYDSIVPLILKNTFDMNDTFSGVVMALDNVLALFMLPLFGFWSDRVKTRMGRRMPFIIFGTLAASVLVMLLPIADNLRSLPLFMAGLVLVLICMATYRSPAVALMPDVTPKPLRSKGNAVINLMGAVGGLVSLLAIGQLVSDVEKPSYVTLFLFLIGFMLISLAVLLYTTKEPKLTKKMHEESEAFGITEDSADGTGSGAREPMPAEVKKSFFLILASIFLWFMGYNAVTTAFSKYANVYWGLTGGSFAYTLMVAQIAAIISYFPVGIVASIIGRRKTILIGISILSVAFGVAAFFQSFGFMIFIFFALAGIGWASINVNSYPMIVEMCRGSDVGRYTGFYYTVSMSAQIITPILSGALLEYGYRVLGSANLDAGYVFLFPYGALFVAASFVTMFFVKHGDSRPPKPKSKLESIGGDD